jgi:ribosomal protein S18 acetylase RimI-like enzyme
MSIRLATADDDAFVGRAFRRMWLDVGIEEAGIVGDAEARVQAFIDDARERLDFRAFIAEHEGTPIGCAAAQRFAGLYPDVLSPAVRRYAYLWGVWVDAEHRRQGLGKALTQAAVDSLRGDYTHVLLHAAPMGKGLYERLGFAKTNEMKLEL